MKHLVNIVCAICLIVFSVVCLTACQSDSKSDTYTMEDGARLQEEGKLIVTASLHNTPFEDKTAYEPYGFTVDLMKKVAEQMGLECEYTASKYPDALASCVQSGGDADAIASSLLASEVDSDESLAYTDSYLDFDLGLAVHKHSSYKKLDDFKGKKICVAKDSDSESYAQYLVKTWEDEGVKGTEIIDYESSADALSDCQANNVDGVIAEMPALKYYTRVMYYKNKVIDEIGDFNQSFVFAVASGNEQLAADINSALQALKDSGEYQTLYDSWFNVDETLSNPKNAIIPPQDQQGYAK